eukprot:ANDGO_07747.mRNA.1 Myb-like protein C
MPNSSEPKTQIPYFPSPFSRLSVTPFPFTAFPFPRPTLWPITAADDSSISSTSSSSSNSHSPVYTSLPRPTLLMSRPPPSLTPSQSPSQSPNLNPSSTSSSTPSSSLNPSSGLLPNANYGGMTHNWQLFNTRQQRTVNKWSPEDDEKLLLAISEHGLRSWTRVASAVSGKTVTACYQRYHRSLRSDIRKGTFEPVELVRLAAAVVRHGQRWCEVAKELPGRCDAQCRMQWNRILRAAGSSGGGATATTTTATATTVYELVQLARMARDSRLEDLEKLGEACKDCGSWMDVRMQRRTKDTLGKFYSLLRTADALQNRSGSSACAGLSVSQLDDSRAVDVMDDADVDADVDVDDEDGEDEGRDEQELPRSTCSSRGSSSHHHYHPRPVGHDRHHHGQRHSALITEEEDEEVERGEKGKRPRQAADSKLSLRFLINEDDE